ncbi:MAG: hypothetical protein ABFD54_07810 [Armatimonadota bacterium]|nr:hypothetical protein [bacterium]
MMKIGVLLGCVLLAVAMLAGCGSDGGGGSSTLATSAVTRQLTSGDQLTYNVNDATKAGVTGTMTVKTTDAPLQPYEDKHLWMIETTQDFTVSGEKVTETSTEYVAQGSDGIINVGYIRDGKTYIGQKYEGIALRYASPIEVGTNWTCTTTYNEGVQSTCSYEVLGMEAANGRMAYKIKIDKTEDGATQTFYEWYVPDLGYPVKVAWTESTDDGDLNVEANLKNKNF